MLATDVSKRDLQSANAVRCEASNTTKHPAAHAYKIHFTKTTTSTVIIL